VAPGGRGPDLEGRVAMARYICAISQRLSRRGGTVVTAARYRRMELMGCPPLSLPTLDPRSYRIPAAGKEASSGEMAPAAVVRRVIDKELSRVRGRCEQEVYDAGRFKEARRYSSRSSSPRT